jgi:glyoxylase-like metal-dependent hydrolase (beta-lactamase superfamily II)
MIGPFQLGDAGLTLFNTGSLRANLAGWFNLEPGDWPLAYDYIFATPLQVPTQSIHVQLPDGALLVDAGLYDVSPDSPFAIPGYQPPPALPEQMTAAGIDPAAVTHVVITHAHFDHFNGVTMLRGGQPAPTFPNARYHLSRAEWNRDEMQTALQDPPSTEHMTFGVLAQLGKLELVDGDRELGHGVTILAAPGETPGHQVVRIRTAGGTLYCVGDLYHHEVEVERPEWVVHWADAETLRASRAALLADARDDDTLMVATHIAGVGRIRRTGSGLRWERVR